jgi:hypothetical protein
MLDRHREQSLVRQEEWMETLDIPDPATLVTHIFHQPD